MTAFVAALLLAASAPSAPAHAQPLLRVTTGSMTTVRGTAVNGGPAFPAAALEHLGFTLDSRQPGTLSAVLGTDTLRFWDTSPVFRHGSRTYQLAYGVGLAEGVFHLPEQLFIQWLPRTLPTRFEYRDGVLARRDLLAANAGRGGSAASAAQPAAANRDALRNREREAARNRERVVVIDPGHGGVDPGRVGPNGLREKDVTLRISRQLADVLRERGYEVHLTRDRDTLIALADRAAIANRLKADRPGALFLSIHANAATSSSARGFETFFLSEARTDDERRVAEMENEAVQYEETASRVAGNGLDQILAGLRSDFLLRASHDLAAAVQERMAHFHPGPNRGVKRAGFLVLVGAVMPAVLVETAFISNRDEAALLGDVAFQQKLAQGMADAVDEFFRRNEHLWTQQP